MEGGLDGVSDNKSVLIFQNELDGLTAFERSCFHLFFGGVLRADCDLEKSN